MPWIRAKLRDAVVFARANQDGTFAVESGRVEIRYRPKDGRRYRALAANLSVVDGEILPDDTCADAQEVPRREEAAKVAGGLGQAASRGSGGEGDLPGTVIEAWTDGACSGNPGPAGLGLVLFLDGERIEVSEYLGRATNNVAELSAIQRALERIPRDASAVIRTDSQYSIGVLQKGWKAKANVELVAGIKTELAARRHTRLLYTPGHAGVSLNERADQLARQAVATASSSERRYPVSIPKGGEAVPATAAKSSET